MQSRDKAEGHWAVGTTVTREGEVGARCVVKGRGLAGWPQTPQRTQVCVRGGTLQRRQRARRADNPLPPKVALLNIREVPGAGRGVGGLGRSAEEEKWTESQNTVHPPKQGGGHPWRLRSRAASHRWGAKPSSPPVSANKVLLELSHVHPLCVLCGGFPAHGQVELLQWRPPGPKMLTALTAGRPLL